MDLYIGAGVLVLLLGSHWWAYRKGLSRGILRASLEAAKRERDAQADVARLRGQPGDPWGGGVRRVEKPDREPAGPGEGEPPAD